MIRRDLMSKEELTRAASQLRQMEPFLKLQEAEQAVLDARWAEVAHLPLFGVPYIVTGVKRRPRKAYVDDEVMESIIRMLTPKEVREQGLTKDETARAICRLLTREARLYHPWFYQLLALANQVLHRKVFENFCDLHRVRPARAFEALEKGGEVDGESDRFYAQIRDHGLSEEEYAERAESAESETTTAQPGDVDPHVAVIRRLREMAQGSKGILANFTG